MATATSPALTTDLAATDAWREFNFSDGTSNKFWKIKLEGDSHTVQYGRIGTSGQEQTKSFGDAAKAQKDYDKLIAQKLGKGYAEVGTTGAAKSSGAASPSAPPKTATAKTKSPKSAPVAAAHESPAPTLKSTARPEAAIGGEVKHELHLDPTDWFWAMWRDPVPLERPQPPEFDQKNRLERIRKHRGGYPFPAESFVRASSLTPEEAHFWYTALTTETGKYGNDHFKELVTVLEGKSFNGKLKLDQIKKTLSTKRTEHCAEFTLCLATLFSPIEIYDFVVDDWKVTQYYGKAEVQPGWAEWMIPGFQRYVLPYLSRQEREALKAHVKKHLKTLPLPVHNDPTANWAAWMFAGILGIHEEAKRVAASWPDDAYKTHQSYPEILVVMGLGSGESFQQQWRRLGFHVNDHERYGGWGRPPEGTWIRAWLAHTGLTALDMIRDSILGVTNKETSEALLKTFARVVDAAEAAAAMLELSQNSKTPRIARQWLEERVTTSVAGLLQLIVQKDKLAADALVFLQDQQHMGHGALIEAQIAAHPAAEAQFVRQALALGEGNTYEALTEKTTPKWLSEGLAEAPKLAVAGADFVSPRRLPPITIEGKKLTDEQTQRLLLILQRATFENPPQLFALLKKHADRASLDGFVWNLFEQWLVEASSKQKWAMTALGHLGGDQVALKLTPLVRKWPGESQHQRSVTGLDCLRAIGSDTALMQLNGVAQKVKFKGIKQKAQEFMEEIAKQKGLTRSQLEDRIVPDCDLDERGSRTFDFGPRKFFFTLGGDMKPLVRDEDKKLLKDLPKPGAKDDKVKAEEAVADWKLLKAQLREVLKVQAGRLEQAMVTGRSWPLEEFEALLVKHPLMTNLARTVLWGAYDSKGKLKDTFRVTEEQDYADSKDEPYQLKGIDSVGIVHPLHLDEATSQAWGEVLGDYEIAAPFPQLGRTVYKLDPKEEKTDDLKRFHDLVLVAPTLVFTLEKLGWVRGMAMDGGCFDEHSKQFPAADITAIVNYEGTVGMGYIDPNETLTVKSVQFLSGMREPSGYGWKKEAVLKLGAVPPVVISEVLADLTALAAKGK